MTDTRPPERRVLLLELAERTSSKGTTWLSGWLGKAPSSGSRARSRTASAIPTGRSTPSSPASRSRRRLRRVQA
jgi:hypothetical protein